MAKKVLVAFPPVLMEQMDFIAKAESRTRSDLLREAARRYIDNFKKAQGAHMLASGLSVAET